MNKIYKTLLAIASLFILLPSAVNADSFSGTVVNNGVVVSHVFWTGLSDGGSNKMYRGKNNKNMYIYHYNSEIYAVKKGSKTLKAICIDPGVNAGTSKEVTCQSIESPAIVHAIETAGTAAMTSGGDDHVKLELAVRALAIKAGITSGTENSTNTPGAAVKNFFINGVSNISPTLIYNASVATGKGETQINQLNYGQTGGAISGALSLYNESLAYTIGGASDGDTSGTGTFLHSLTSSSATTKEYTYKLSSTKVLNQANFKIKCTDCTVKSFTWSNKIGKLVVVANNPDCKFKVLIKYKDGSADDDSDHKLYLCTPVTSAGTSRNTQRFVAYDDGTGVLTDDEDDDTDEDGFKTIDTIDQTETCSDDDCPCNREDFKDDEDINMCCDESTLSYVIQPKISELFCKYTSTGVVVNGYKANCVAEDTYKVDNDFLSSDYCELYCTERMFVTIPKATNGRNGKYFEIESVNPNSKGPYFEGTKTCRLVTHYNKWVDDYETYTIRAVDGFNEYQRKSAIRDMYTRTYNNKINGQSYKTDKTKNRSITYKNDSVAYTCKGVTEHTSISKTQDEACTLKYKAEIATSDYKTVKFKRAKISWKDGTASDAKSPLDSYYGLTITNDTDGSIEASSGLTGYYDVSWNDENCGKTSSSSVSCDKKVSCDGSEITVSGTCYYSSVSGDLPTDIKSDFNDLKDTDPSSEGTKYTNNVEKINKLETYLEECLNYFDGGGKGTETQTNPSGNSPYKLYDFDPTVTFYYFQAYVKNTTNNVEALENPIDFKVTCSYSLTPVGESADGEEANLGLEGWHYNELNLSHKDSFVKNFEVPAIKCLSDSGLSGCTNTAVTAAGLIATGETTYNQRYTSDAYFKAICNSNDVDKKSYILYPYGSFTTDSHYSSTLKTVHDVSYYIEYSTLTAAYETYWQFTGLGTRGTAGGVFDDKFKNNGLDTCGSHKNESGNARLYCTLGIRSSLSKLKGCNEEGVISLQSNAPYFWNSSNGCCPGGSCHYDGEDELTYSFKIVDSDDIFPDNGVSEDGEYAYNWLQTPYGTDAKDKITSTASAGNTFAESRKTYEFTLTTSDMEAIKKYNATRVTSGGYADFDLTCTCTDPSDSTATTCNGHFRDCKSKFIADFYGGTVGGTALSTSRGTAALNTARSSLYYHKAE